MKTEKVTQVLRAISKNYQLSFTASKRMHILHQSFLTFPKYQKQKFWTKFEFEFLTLPPAGRGV